MAKGCSGINRLWIYILYLDDPPIFAPVDKQIVRMFSDYKTLICWENGDV